MKNKKERWVIKAGSQMVVAGGPALVRSWMAQIAELQKKNIEVIWVTSGAIATAVQATQIKRNRGALAEKQALSAIGQPLIMNLYNDALQKLKKLGAQILLTYDDLDSEKRKNNFIATLEQLLQWNVLPILNENDAVATEEIRFGDNDSLSAKVAIAVRADRLVILTDVAGVFDRDPKKHRGAKRISKLNGVSDKLLNATSPTAGSERGTGGMYSKLHAAREATERAIETYLVKGDESQILESIRLKKNVGTRVTPSKKGRL